MPENLSEKIRAIDLPTIAEAAGVELRARGGVLFGCCCFHSEKTPSLKISQDSSGKWRFYCFGCHEKGDALDFVQLRYGLDLPAALSFLGIENDRPENRPDPVAISQAKQKRELRALFDRWQRAALHTYTTLYRSTKRAMMQLTPESLDELGVILQPLSKWGYWIDVLTFGSDAEKWALFKEHSKNRTSLMERGKLFDDNFNFLEWLKRGEKPWIVE